MEKEEENYAAIVSLREENGKLARQLKQNAKNTDSEREIIRLSGENESLKKQIADLQAAKTSLNSSDLFAPCTEVSVKDEAAFKVKLLREENARLLTESKAIQSEKDRLESFLVDVKIRSANLDLENDQLACKLQQKNDMIKMLSERVTALEVEVLRSKQELGEALNTVYEYEQTTADKAIVHNDSAGSDSQES